MKKLFIIFMLLSPSAFASITGQQIVEFGKAYQKFVQKQPMTTDEKFQSNYLLGYISGVFDVTANISMYCPPAGFSFGSGVDLVITYAKNHPESLKQIGSEVVLDAMRNSFKCSEAPEWMKKELNK